MIIPTGIKVAVPNGYELQVRPRSGLAAKNGVTVLNSPGTVDSGYRGEVGVILTNFDKRLFKVSHGDRIAQMIVKEVPKTVIEVVEELTDTERGSGGFGSTGV
jgi:dUTP pyrophosphatase